MHLMTDQSVTNLTETELGAIEAIVKGVNAWSMAKDLEAAGHTPEVLASLEAAGFLEPWDLAIGRAWILTKWGAAELGVVIIEDHRDEPRWGYPGQEPKEFRIRLSSRFARIDPAWLAAKTMTPLEAAIHAEDVEQFLLDPDTMLPLRLFGRMVPVDAKVKGIKRTPKQKAAASKRAAKFEAKAAKKAKAAKAKRARETSSMRFGKWGRPIGQAG